VPIRSQATKEAVVILGPELETYLTDTECP
jgi:hypothetical protein